MHKLRHHAKRSALKDGRRNHVANAATKHRVVEGSKSVINSKNGATSKGQQPAVGSVKDASPTTIGAAPVRRKRALVDATAARIKPFVCNVCGRTYAHSFILRRHQLSHGKDRHTCKVCGQQFIRKDNLNIHVAVKHTGAKPYKCSSCSSSFDLRRFLTYHVKRYHQTQQDAAMDCSDSPGKEMLSDGEANGGHNVTLNPVNLSAAFNELDENAHEPTSRSDATSELVGDAQSRNDAVAESAAGSEQANANGHSDSAASTSQEGLATENEDVVSVPLFRLLELERTAQHLAVYLTGPTALRKLAEHQAAIQQLIQEAKLRTDKKANENSAETVPRSETQRGPGYGRLVTDSDTETDDDSDLPVRNVVIDWDEDTDLDEYFEAKMEFQRKFAEWRRKDEQEFGPTERFPLWPRVHVEFEEEFEEES